MFADRAKIYIRSPEKAETDMSASAVKLYVPDGGRMAATAVMAADVDL